MAEPYVTPLVRTLAAQNGVDLKALTGTGISGRIRPSDVLAAAGVRPSPGSPPVRLVPSPAARAQQRAQEDATAYAQLEQELFAGMRPESLGSPIATQAGPTALDKHRQALAAAAASSSSRAAARTSLFAGVQVVVDDYAANPLVEDLKQALPDVYAMAVKDGPAPTVFVSGDLPPFTASGVDPRVLLQLPWFARHAAAACSDAGDVLEMLEDAAAPDGVVLLQMEGHAESEGATEYVLRVKAWAAGANTADRQAQQAAADFVADFQ